MLSATLLVSSISLSAFAKEPNKEYNYVALGDSIAAGYGLENFSEGDVTVPGHSMILTENLIANPVEEAYVSVFGKYLEEVGKANGCMTTATNLASVAYRAEDIQKTIMNKGYKGEIAAFIFETFLGEGASAPLEHYHDIYLKYLKDAELVSIQLGGNDSIMWVLVPILLSDNPNPILLSVGLSLVLTLFGNDLATSLGGGLQVLMQSKDKITYQTVTEAAEYVSKIASNGEYYVQLAFNQVKGVVEAVKTVNDKTDIALIGMFNPYGNSLVYDGQVRDVSNIIRNIFVKSAEMVCGKTIKTDEAGLLSDEEVEEKTDDFEKDVTALSKFVAKIKKFTGSCKAKFTKWVSAVANEISYPMQYMTAGNNVAPQMLSLNEHLKNYADETGIVYVDVYNIANECNLDPHPNAQGHREIAEIMQSVLADTVKKGMTGTAVPVATSVKLNKNIIFVNEGKTYKLKAVVAPTGASQTVTWSTNNSKVAVVDRNGTVTGIKAGTAVITATTPNGKKFSCQVTVKNNKTSVLQFIISKTSVLQKIF